MHLVALEGIVEQGQIKLNGKIQLPEKTKVYVIFPELKVDQVVRIFSPHLAHPEEAKLFEMG